tara:strand:+ start:320 stop:640 length:321 start_codon:yes stop_codon:yes gene_type:complete
VFQILIGNLDDHACIHAEFWTGKGLHLPPPYDIDSHARASYEANWAMAARGTDHRAQFALPLEVAGSSGSAQGRDDHRVGRLRRSEICIDVTVHEADLMSVDYIAL